MRPKHPHAAESGVGKYIARESERAQVCITGKERVANAHPQNLAPGPQGPGAIFFRDLSRKRGDGGSAEKNNLNSRYFRSSALPR